MKSNSIYLLLLLLLTAGFTACKKTIGLDPIPQNKILEYKVANLTDTVIYGSVNNLNNTITVYLPVFYGLNLIDAEIKVSDGASLTEAAGIVDVHDQGKTYSVKAADGSINTYKLKIVVMNPLKFEVSWPAFQLVDEIMTSYPYNASTGLSLSGNFNATGTGLTRIEMTNQRTGKVLKIDEAMINRTSNGLYNSNIELAADVDTGYYKVKVDYFGQVASPAQLLHIIHRQPDLLISSKTAKQGETISFTSFNSIFLNLKSVKVKLNEKDTYDLPVVGYTATSMTLRIPDNFPVGNYDYTAQYSFEFDTWKTVSKYGSLTVDPK